MRRADYGFIPAGATCSFFSLDIVKRLADQTRRLGFF